MVDPSVKNPAIEHWLESTFGRSTALKNSVCVACSQPVKKSGFKDPKSWAEYRISGLCQACQDEIWK